VPYWLASVYSAPDSVTIHLCRTKDKLIDLLMHGFNPDHDGVFNTLREAKEYALERAPNYKIKRSDVRVFS